mmetsp:Transcript_41283/g.46920  ORF Transcript_41283/g.46920 Transcript_41283/m.46920 type:complete len:302 (+) Transcript_41283:225-1130(+)
MKFSKKSSSTNIYMNNHVQLLISDTQKIKIKEEYDDDNISTVATDSNNNITIISLIMVEENEDLLSKILSLLDTVSLIQKKGVSVRWRKLCTYAIDSKLLLSSQYEEQNNASSSSLNDTTTINSTTKRKSFDNRYELRTAINDYIDSRSYPENAEIIARLYGWPIGKWDVSKIRDFSRVFREKDTFNEDIGPWDVSNVVDMSEMFWNATSFNRDLSKWNTHNVRTMGFMFYKASSFNQDISAWNTKNVKSMRYMFMRATTFNQNISSWNTRRIKENRFIFGMFDGATLFDCEKFSPKLMSS